MTLHLPKPIARYFATDATNGEAVAACFTENAVVKDEGHTHTGLAAIKKWKTGAATKYTYTIKPFASEEKDGNTIVTGRVTGNFPGSPVDLQFVFGVKGERISSLEIT